MTKFINVFLITISITIFLALAALGITYLVEPNLVKDWIGIEQVEQIEPETPEEPEEPTEPTEPEEPTDPETPEEPEEIVYVTNVADYEFVGETLTAYNGSEKNISLPSSYSIAGTENVELTFNDQFELLDYVAELMFSTYPFPLTVTDNENQEYVFNSEMEILENYDVVYPVKMEVEKTIYVEGDDYQVTEIGNQSFQGADIENVIIPNSILSIGNNAFQNCKLLKNITIPSSVTNIESFAFSNCDILEKISIPASVTNIGDNAFYGCVKLTSIEVDEDNAIYLSEDGILFNKDNTILLCFPAGKTGNYSIPNFLIELGPNSFSDTSLATIDFSNANNLKTIGESAFNLAKNLKSIIVPEGVTSIGDNAFAHCYELTYIELPSTISVLGRSLCSSNSNLETFIIHDETPANMSVSFSYSFFLNCNKLEGVYVPSTSVEAYKTAWSDYADLIKSIDELEVA